MDILSCLWKQDHGKIRDDTVLINYPSILSKMQKESTD